MIYKSKFKLLAYVFTFIITLTMAKQSSSQGNDDIFSLAWSPDGTRIAVVGSNGKFYVWDALQQHSLFNVNTLVGNVDDVVWSPDNTKVATVGQDRIIHIWSAVSGTLIMSLNAYPQGRLSIAWSPDGSKIACLASEEYAPLQIWNVADDYKLIATSDNGTFYSLAWSPDGGKIAIAAFSGIKVIDNVTSAILPNVYLAPNITMLTVAWSPDGSKLAAGDNNGLVHILSTKSGNELNKFQAHAGIMIKTLWSPDGSKLLTTGADKYLRIWDMNTSNKLSEVSSDNYILASDWSPYAGRIAYSSALGKSAQPTVESKDVQFFVIAQSSQELQALTKRCTKPDVQQTLTSKLDAKQLPAFTSAVKALTSDQIPPACAADLVAVAEAFQAKP